ncbi:tRNA dihydrouridine synthase [Desulfoplanes sp.]
MTTSGLPISPDTPWLAPLAGFSDLPFRLLCRAYGASVACTEMVSAKGLVYDSKGTRDLLAATPDDSPLVVQLFGSQPEYIARAMDILLDMGVRYFDLNCGCSVRKVVKTGAGAALLKTPDELPRLVEIMATKAGEGNSGVKIRSGWSGDEKLIGTLGPRLERAGAGWITLHPRSARQGFSGTAHWEDLSLLKKSVSVPVIASGDLLGAEDAVRCLEQTGADAVMFARGALNDPGIFKRFLGLVHKTPAPEKSPTELVGMIKKFMELTCRHGDEKKALLRMRTLAPRFVKGFPGSRSARARLCTCRTWEEFARGIEEIASR